MTGTVCDTQDQFNDALYTAAEYSQEKDRPDRWTRTVCLVLTVLILLWALNLANRTSGDRVLHFVLALAFAPIYIIATFLNGK